jgi:predicted DsbA family dithiol-disulfide isomerase
MNGQSSVELWEWAEYDCPWCYVTTVRLHQVQKEYEGRVSASVRFFPLELVNGEGPPRDILEQEWWQAALQENGARFVPYPAIDWPASTLPAFDAAWAARQQGHRIAMDFDLKVRRAFFADGRNIGRHDVLLDLAHEVDLDFARFERDFASPMA